MTAALNYEPRVGSVAWRAIEHLKDQPYGAELSTSALALGAHCTVHELLRCLEPAQAARAIFQRQKGGHERSPIFWSLVEHGQHKPAFPVGPRQPAEDDEPPATGTVVDAEFHDPGADGPTPAELHGHVPDALPGMRPREFVPAVWGVDLEQPTKLVWNEETTEGRASQQVLKAEPATADATDRDAPVNASPVGGPTGAEQPAAAGLAVRLEDGEAPHDAEPPVVPIFTAMASAAVVEPVSAPVVEQAAHGFARFALWSDGRMDIETASGQAVQLSVDETRALVRYLERLGEVL